MHSLALCTIDSIYWTGTHYSSVVKVVCRCRADRATRHGNVGADATEEQSSRSPATALLSLPQQCDSASRLIASTRAKLCVESCAHGDGQPGSCVQAPRLGDRARARETSTYARSKCEVNSRV
jgi:hypothetical protein